MADKLLISISGLQVSAARWHGGRIAGCNTFAHNEDGLGEFKNYLKHCSNLSAQILVDATEEDYRQEPLPHSFGAERSEMVNRKLKQYYRNTPYCTARLQGRDSVGRRDDRYLFCAITNPDLIASWLQAVMERGLPVVGIYLLPAVSESMVAKLQLKQSKLLLASVDSSGLRLTFLRDQKLRVSRLAHVDSGVAQPLANYAEEISSTRLYLHALRILTLDEQLTVLIVDPRDSLARLVEMVAHDNPNVECLRLGRKEIVAQLGVSMPTLDSSSAALSLHLLGLRAPESNLAPAHVTAGYHQHQARRGLYALTGTIAFAAAAWCAFTWYQIFDIKSETMDVARQTAQLQAQYLEVTRRFPAAPTSAENLKRAVEISQKIGATTRSPEIMMNIVSQALESNPAIALKTLGWKYDRANIESEPLKSFRPAGDASTPGAASERRQSGLIEGEVLPFRGDYRGAIESINRFAETLSKQAEVAEVSVTKLPLNVNPGLTLSGNTTDSREQSGKAEFKLLLVLKQAK